MHFLVPMLDLHPLHRSNLHNASYDGSIKKIVKITSNSRDMYRRELVIPVTTY